jgi:hypothetical protein
MQLGTDSRFLHCGLFVGLKGNREVWPGGYIHRQQDGRPLYIIEREVNGRRHHRSTRTHSLKAAMKHLERFEADPASYRPQGVEEEDPVQLTADLVAEYQRWQINKGISERHARDVAKRLANWIEDLDGTDLRKVSLRDHIKPALAKRVTMRAHRISTIKSFYAWLREEKHLLTSANDPTLDLPVPQSVPEKRKRRKALDINHVQKVAGLLGPVHRDVLIVLAATGMHFTELERFASSPESEIDYRKRGTTIASLVMRHKNRDTVSVAVVDRDVLKAAERLRELGRIPTERPEGADYWMRPNEAIAFLCARHRPALTPFTLGQMRATVGTWLAEQGMTREQVAAFLHHKDPRTTARFYLDIEVPTVPVAPPKLVLVKS